MVKKLSSGKLASNGAFVEDIRKSLKKKEDFILNSH